MDKGWVSSLRIESMMACQLRCPTCITGSGEIHSFLPRGYLRAEDFKKLIVSGKGKIRKIELSNYGETFLNPQIVDILRIAFENNVRITVKNGTNFNNVREEALEALVKYRVQDIVCSIDGATEEVYKIYRIGGKFPTVIENIRKLNAYKKKYNAKFPRLYWQFVVFGHNEHQISDARKLAHELGMKFYTKLSWDSGISPVRDKDKAAKEAGIPAVNREDYFEKKGRLYNNHICEQLWNQTQINVDGRVLGCCINSWAEFGGNAFEDLFGALNSEKIKASRRALMGLEDMREDSPCARCTHYLTRKEHGIWVEPHTPKKWLKRAARDLIFRTLRVGPKPKVPLHLALEAAVSTPALVTIKSAQGSGRQE